MSASTKQKILETSMKLFAEKNFEAVSIREIAQECDVNVAAINYHFQSKEILYINIIKECVTETRQEIQKIYEGLKNNKTIDLTISIFEHYLKNAEKLKTNFKIIISPQNFHEKIMADFPRFTGPPGGEYLKKCIENEVPSAVDKDLDWGVRTIFTQIIHKALILSNQSICQSLSESGIGKDVLKSDIDRLVKLVIGEIASSK